jgi:cytochrome c
MRSLVLLFAFTACHDEVPHVATGGDAARGRTEIVRYGCAACHQLPDIKAIGGRGGLVRPPLVGFARRSYIGGVLPNTPENLVQWIRDPHAIDDRTAMPTLGLTDKEARDVAAYLYTLD